LSVGHPTYAHAYAWGRDTVEPYDWAIAFEKRVRELLVAEETNPLIDYEDRLGQEAIRAVPTPASTVTRIFLET